MNITELKSDKFSKILKINNEKLNKYEGYDLDNFARECAAGKIEGIKKGATKASADIIYIVNRNKKLYKIEGKDISKVVENKIKGFISENVTIKEFYIDGIKNNKDRIRKEKGKLEPHLAIDMESKIKGTDFLLSNLEDYKLYIDKGYILLINYDLTESQMESLLEKADYQDRVEIELSLLALDAEIEEVKNKITEILSSQEGFELCGISKLEEILDS